MDGHPENVRTTSFLSSGIERAEVQSLSSELADFTLLNGFCESVHGNRHLKRLELDF
jgi:hypothetical protein